MPRINAFPGNVKSKNFKISPTHGENVWKKIQ